MTKSTYKHIVDPDGTEYFIQDIDEMDKNHGVEDFSKANEGKMYATNGKKNYLKSVKISLETRKSNKRTMTTSIMHRCSKLEVKLKCRFYLKI